MIFLFFSKNLREKIISLFFCIVSITALVILIGIFVFLFSTGINSFSEIGFFDFFFGSDWNPDSFHKPSWGIFGLIAGTLIVTFLALLFAVPVGIASAIYLSEIARPNLRETLKPLIEMIAGIPSVVLGLIGILFLSPVVAEIFGLSIGLNALTAGLLVGVMILPTVISISEDVITSLPLDFRHASYALGATKFQTIKNVLLPAALPGITAAVMLGLGRAVGETMAVLMVAGNSRAFPQSIFDPVRPMTANIAIEIKEVVVGSLHYQALFAIGLVLFVMTFVVNFASDLILERHGRRYAW